MVDVIGITWLITLWVGMGGQTRPWVLGTQTPVFCFPQNEVFHFFPLFLHHQNNRFKIVSIFYLPILNSVTKQNLFLGRKKVIGGGDSPHPPLAPPKLLQDC